MAPNLVQTYRKQLDTDPEGMTNEVTFQHFMIARRRLAILALTEYRMSDDSDFSCCLVVTELGVDEWLTDAIEDDSQWSEEELLASVADARSGLARQVYQYLRGKYGCVVSDDMQTLSGALLWLIGINQLTSQCIEVYDAQRQSIRGYLGYPIKPGSFKPWCLTGLTHQQITQESSSKFDVVDYAEHDDKRHILFLLR